LVSDAVKQWFDVVVSILEHDALAVSDLYDNPAGFVLPT
jgi:hypothetical protein